MSDASEITRRANSNLAFALRILPPELRADAVVFYAFCRTMDDLADDPGLAAEERAASLSAWRRGLAAGFESPTPFQAEVLEMRDRRGIPNELLEAVIDGCLMDLEPRRYRTWDDLSEYIWKVACAVGLVSIRLFGCEHPASERYAVALGRALQLTNILRDIDEDAEIGRLYLPREALQRAHIEGSDPQAVTANPHLADDHAAHRTVIAEEKLRSRHGGIDFNAETFRLLSEPAADIAHGNHITAMVLDHWRHGENRERNRA